MKSEKTKTLLLPLVGTRQNGKIFNYLLLKINDHSALISIPNWTTERSSFNNSEQVSLHLKYPSKDNRLIQERICGQAEALDSHKIGYENLYRIHFDKPLTGVHERKSLMGLKSELIHLLKDSFFLKNGIDVYLKHLIPYFTRILTMTKAHYDELKAVMLNDVHQCVHRHLLGLENLYQSLDEKIKDDSDLPVYLDLEELRKLIQSEIDLDLFTIALSEAGHYKQGKRRDAATDQPFSLKSYQAYLEAIKIVEYRLYDNYNSIVNLYIQSFERAHAPL